MPQAASSAPPKSAPTPTRCARSKPTPRRAGTWSAASLSPCARPAPASIRCSSARRRRRSAPSTHTAFLGLMDGAPRFALGDRAGGDGSAQDAATTSRSPTCARIAVRGMVAEEHLPPLAEGKSLLLWHARRRFCSNCGARDPRSVDAGWRRDCPSCKMQHFPRTDPVVIMLAIDGERCLLGRSGRFATNSWSCLAGFVEPGETIEDAVRREVHEEAGIVCGEVKYFRSQPWPFPSSLMIGCHAQALSRDARRRSQRARRRALVRPRGGRVDAGAAASGRA